ncbi:hypothetical protein JCM12294_44570 [Desulfocicer niacini]
MGEPVAWTRPLADNGAKPMYEKSSNFSITNQADIEVVFKDDGTAQKKNGGTWISPCQGDL